MRRETIYEIFSHMPTLQTERLILRPMRALDAEDMYDYARRAEVTRFLLWSPHPSIAYTREYLQYVEGRYAVGDFYDWAVVEKESDRMIGTCGFTEISAPHRTAQIGYVLNPDFHDRGFASEAAREVLRFGFEVLELQRIEARFMVDNEASLRVMEKLGMTFEGYLRHAMYVKGSHRTIGVCSILREEVEEREVFH